MYLEVQRYNFFQNVLCFQSSYKKTLHPLFWVNNETRWDNNNAPHL